MAHVSALLAVAVAVTVAVATSQAVQEPLSAIQSCQRHVSMFGMPLQPADLSAAIAATTAAQGAFDTVTFATWVVGRANMTLGPVDATLLKYYEAATGLGMRVVPMVPVSAAVAVEGGAAYAPLIQQLLEAALQHGWAGYAFDCETGSNKALSYKLREFLNAAADAMHPHNLTVQWFMHGGWHPEISAASRGDVMWDMDSYHVWQTLLAWVEDFGAKGGVGLEVGDSDFPTTAGGMDYLFRDIYAGSGAVNLGFWCCWEMGSEATRQLLYPRLQRFLANSTCGA